MSINKLQGHLDAAIRQTKILKENHPNIDTGLIMTNLNAAISCSDTVLSEIVGLEGSNEDLRELLDEAEANQYSQHLDKVHQNIRVESLFENFDQIGIENLEKFIETHLNPVQA
ncbi:hypothetical protein [Muricauda sp. MAR_2010_75]|uniref:hypothetical protein n=1 Tax=Allomuricauda sp. MAR_2010_75 TaxID=1250232 RepID=UPI00055B20BA|nr:hypothetical protein [Muricauda sp. MAR_2010_75]